MTNTSFEEWMYDVEVVHNFTRMELYALRDGSDEQTALKQRRDKVRCWTIGVRGQMVEMYEDETMKDLLECLPRNLLD